MPQIKIFLLINSLSHGGTEQIISTLSTQLSQDFDIQVVTLSGNGEVHYDTGKPPIPLYVGKKDASKIKKLIVSFIRYIQIIIKERPDVILSSHPETNLLNLTTYKFLGVKAIISIHEYPYQEFPVRRAVARLVRYIGDCVVVVSSGLKDLLCTEFLVNSEMITVIYNPVEVNRFISSTNFTETPRQLIPATSHATFFNTEKHILINIGNPSHVKGQWHLIRIFRELQKTHPSKLIICGDGSLSDYLKDMVSHYDLGKDVLFSGKVDDVQPYLRSSDVFVLSSLSEGFGIVLVEALACGCPIVASDCPFGPREILENGKNGLLCTAQTDEYPDFDAPLTDSEKDMLEKITLLLENPELRKSLSENGIERAKDFRPEIACKKYEDVIHAVLSEK
ncbi:MAG: glycosyltransferase [Methanocorpusculum sp.]|nr:glycosyltransferase [Oscillospiraceae bacterium]MBQ3570057.1 glycosyltransferase [Methanocorpusculum sp.]